MSDKLILKSAAPTKGKQYGGKYVARVQIGFNKDNSPKYRYFEKIEEYRGYLEHQSKTKGGNLKHDKNKKDKVPLKEKLAAEHKDKPGPDKKPSLFVKKKEKK